MRNEEEIMYVGEDEEPARIGGWLAFFLFVGMMGGSTLSVVMTFAQINVAETGGSWLLALADPVFAVLMLALAVYTLVAFIRRKPDAVFLAKAYVVGVLVSGILAFVGTALSGETVTDATPIIRPIVWGCIWLVFLFVSTRVEEVLPRRVRHASGKDWLIVGVVMGVPVLMTVIGVVQARIAQSGYERQRTEFLASVVLADGEYTDGRVVFACPEGFSCEKEEVDGETFYYMETETQSITIASEYNSGDPASCARTYWKESEEASLRSYRYEADIDEERQINGNKAIVKTGKYTQRLSYLNEQYVYRRFAVIFHKASGKVCLVNCFDLGDDSYFSPFLHTIRFE